MAERMSVTQALDERDLLVKQINDGIEYACFTGVTGCGGQMLPDVRISETEFVRRAERDYGRVIELIERYHRIHMAIMEVNADTWIDTSFGRFTVSFALSLRSRLRSTGPYEYDGDFEGNLCRKLLKEYEQKLEQAGKEAMTGARFCDPLGAREKAIRLEEKRDRLLRELDSQIKISNAVTLIEL